MTVCLPPSNVQGQSVTGLCVKRITMRLGFSVLLEFQKNSIVRLLHKHWRLIWL